ncbi:MAG: MFS transporter [Rhizobiales bacterium]|nr:MFS transporter [Hyphomicrobiales bacterium]NRB15329.1 MFS transporter [Hyphomicrobiales bacterium]
MLNSIKQFNFTVWFLLTANFCIGFVASMVWPFLAIILYRKYGLNEFETGLFLFSAVLVRAFFGFYVGNLSDRFGRRKVIISGFLTGMCGMYIMASTDNLWVMLLGATLNTTAWGMVANPGKALMTDMMPDREVKDVALQMMFFSMNLARAFGPAFGVFIGLTGQATTFYIVGHIYIVVIIIGLIIFNIEKPKKHTKSNRDQSFKALFSILAQDHAFMLLVVAFTLCLLTYLQMSMSLLQYIRLSGIASLETTFASLLALNGLTIVIFQFPLAALFKNLAPFHRTIIGISLFLVAFIIFAFFTQNGGFGLYAAMFILSIGEAILFPTINIIIDRMAPEHLKGSYFGAAGLNAFGVASAPLLGGYLLQDFGGQTLWLVMAAVSLLAGCLFYFAQTAKRPSFAVTDNSI